MLEIRIIPTQLTHHQHIKEHKAARRKSLKPSVISAFQPPLPDRALRSISQCKHASPMQHDTSFVCNFSLWLYKICMTRTRDELAAEAAPPVKAPLWTRDYILSCTANMMMGLAFFELVPVLPLYLTENLKVSSGWLGWIMSIYVVAAILTRPWFAQKVDSGDRKKIYITVYVLLALSFSGYAVASTALLVFLTRFIQGLIWGGMTTAGPTMAVDIIPPSRRGEGLGFFGMTMTLGMCLGPVIGLQVYQQYGFEIITWSSLVLCLAGAGIASLVHAPKRPVQEAVVETPKKVLDRLVLRVGIPLAVNVMMASFSYGVVAVYSALYGTMYGFQYAGLFYALMGCGMLISRFMVGKQIDRGRVAELSVISLAILTISFAALAFLPQESIYYGAAILIGFGFGIFIPTFQTMKLNMADRGHRGAVNSTFFTAFDIGVGAGMFCGGKIYACLNLNWAFGIGALLNLLAIVYFYSISLNHYRRNKLGVDSD